MIRTLVAMTRRQKALILLGLDFCLVPLSLFLALSLHAASRGSLSLLADFTPYLAVAAGVGAALSIRLGVPFTPLKDYQLSGVLRSTVVAIGVVIVTAVLAVTSGQAEIGHPGVMVSFGLILMVTMIALRGGLFYLVLGMYRRSREVTRVAIYGAGRTGLALAAALRSHPHIVPLVILDDNATLRGLNLCGLPVMSGGQYAKVVDRYKLSRVILAMPNLSADKQTYLSRRFEKLGVEVQTLPSFAQLLGSDDLLEKLTPAGLNGLLRADHLRDAGGRGYEEYRGASVLISGAGGSIGLELCRQVLACRPRQLVMLELSELALYNAEAEMRVLAEAAGVRVVPVLGSVQDGKLVENALAEHRVEIVLHAAAYKHVPMVEANPRVGVSNNTLGTAVLAQKARDAGVRRFVLVSSDKAVRATSIMGASKRFAELVVQDLAARPGKTRFSIVRFGNVMGSSGSVIPLFQEQIARGGPVTLTDPSVTRYFMSIQEAARLVLLAGAFAEGGEVFVLDMGEPVQIRDLAERLIAAAGFTLRNAENPDGDIEIVVTGLRPGEKLYEELMIAPGVQATAHHKIVKVREASLSELEMAGALKALRDAVVQGSDAAVLSAVARAVADYQPNPDAQQARDAAAEAVRLDPPAVQAPKPATLAPMAAGSPAKARGVASKTPAE
ncbi:polysaccharide biosynthesis protein [Phaeovulum sp. W22_SRMD_FR3]|uniref:polysaccharide biosynthesis protein n=1 Tax=Phaeovulum sp. W22_SRMD_FR3 TaxID=3240274 RepID=UPI003F9B7157